MIIGTAGHIDHGKTALIRALTGIDADRLAEEKKRGLTIDLGFAYQPLDDGGVLGFVDVPGHERFVPNMLSGALAVDYVMLVVAADDGPMPQSREHLAIIDLLGLDRGVVALTKTDRVDAARRAQAVEETRALLAGTCLEGAEIVPVSAIGGEGVPGLRERLLAVAHQQSPRARSGLFRLAIDRSFSLSGTGTVVTGTVHSGVVVPGDHLRISPQGLEARVRSIHRQNRAADAAGAGDRCALNLSGRRLDRHAVHRGDWALAPAAHAPTDRVDARLRVLASEGRALRHWTPVHVHVGAADIPARLAVLDGEHIEPGASGLVQLVLDRAVPALRGDRFVVRDQSATHTIGGGRILDAFAPGRGRRKPQRLALLAALEAPDATDALGRLLAIQGFAGLDLDWFERNHNLTVAEARALQDRAGLAPVEAGGRRLLFAPDAWQAMGRAILSLVDQHHQREPASPGALESALVPALRPLLGQRPPVAAVAAAVAELVDSGSLQRSGRRLALPAHRARLSPQHQVLWERIKPRLREGGLRPPRLHELAGMLNESEDLLGNVLKQQAAAGALWQVADNLYFARDVIAEVAAATQRVCEAEDGKLTVRSFRGGTGISRNAALDVLEFFDRTGLTTRVDDGRKLRGDAARLYGRADQAR